MTKTERSAAPVVRTLTIADLVRLPQYQMRKNRQGVVELDGGKIGEYAAAYKAGRVLPPIRVAVVDGAPLVVDGWHRLAALERNETRTVEAEVHEGVTALTALGMAAQANLEHGLPLKRADLRRAFNALIRARKHVKKRGQLASYREIAGMLGNRVPHTTVRHWMLNDHPRIARDMGGADPVEQPRDKEFPKKRLQEILEGNVKQHLYATTAAARGITEPKRRARIIAHVREVLAELEAGAGWVMPDDLADF